MGGGDMKHDRCLPYNPHGRHHHDQYYDLPHEHHVHGGAGQFSPKFINDLGPADFVAGHPHGGHHMIMRRGGRHHHHLIPIFNGLHNKSLHHRAGKMHHHHHGHLHDHSHHHKHKHGNILWHPIKGHHGGRRHHRCHGHKYHDLHRRSDRCHGDCGKSKSVVLVSNSLPGLIAENRPAAGDVDHTIRNSTSDGNEVAVIEVVQQQPDDHDSMEANIPININTLRIE